MPGGGRRCGAARQRCQGGRKFLDSPAGRVFRHFRQFPTVLAEDVTVPVSRIPDLVDHGGGHRQSDMILTIVMIGHAGDGNLHPCVLTDKDDAGPFQPGPESRGRYLYGGHRIRRRHFRRTWYRAGKEEISEGRRIAGRNCSCSNPLKHVFDPQGNLKSRENLGVGMAGGRQSMPTAA